MRQGHSPQLLDSKGGGRGSPEDPRVLPSLRHLPHKGKTHRDRSATDTTSAVSAISASRLISVVSFVSISLLISAVSAHFCCPCLSAVSPISALCPSLHLCSVPISAISAYLCLSLLSLLFLFFACLCISAHLCMISLLTSCSPLNKFNQGWPRVQYPPPQPSLCLLTLGHILKCPDLLGGGLRFEGLQKD